MKHQGATFIYDKERNEDLMRAYRSAMLDCDAIRMPNIYKRVVNSPAKRFWVSEERAAIVISRMFKGDNLDGMRPTKKEMFNEIYRRVIKLQEKYPALTTYELVFKVVQQPAPKFYLTAGSCKVTICKIKKTWFEERKRKLRHLF